MAKKDVPERQERIQRWLNDDREFLPLVSTIDDTNIGRLAKYRWYRFAQLAMWKDGKLLENDANWALVLDEIENWPMMLWVSILDQDTTIAEAKKAYNQMGAGRFTVTEKSDADDDTRDWKLTEMGWVNRGIRVATQLEIWKWVGPVGGQYPTVTTPEPADE